MVNRDNIHLKYMNYFYEDFYELPEEWISYDGPIDICAMSDEHLANTISYLTRNFHSNMKSRNSEYNTNLMLSMAAEYFFRLMAIKGHF